MTTPPPVSVVVPYYRAQADLDRLVAALVAQEYPASRLQLVVADDGSPEPPCLPSGLPFDAVTVRQPDRGFRPAAARALGVRAADGEVLAFLDGDMLPEPNYLRQALAARAGDAPGGVADAVVVGRRRHVRAQAVEAGWRPGAPLAAADVLEEPAWLRRAYADSRDLAAADSTSYRFVISAVLTVARDVYEDAGGFDPAFVGYGGEDWELAHRLWRVGGAFRHAPRAVAWQAGEDFAGRTEPAEAAELKARESLVLASRISAPTARGTGLCLGVSPRLEARVRASSGSAAAAAATVVGVDAVLRAVPGARVTVDGSLDPAARQALADPRVRVEEESAPTPVEISSTAPEPPARGGLAAVRASADWTARVDVPLRPVGPGERPDPEAVAAWLLRLERAGVERVVVLGELRDDNRDAAGGVRHGGRAVLAELTCARARWRPRRGGRARTWRVPATRLGWRSVGARPDLEAWWGGWG